MCPEPPGAGHSFAGRPATGSRTFGFLRLEILAAVVSLYVLRGAPGAELAPGVADVHDLHAWTITSGMNVVSAHVVLRPGAGPRNVLGELCRCLSGADRRRLEERSHA